MSESVHSADGARRSEVAEARRALQEAREKERRAVQVFRLLQVAGAPRADLDQAERRADLLARVRARKERRLMEALAASGISVPVDLRLRRE